MGFPCDALPHLASSYAAVNALLAMRSEQCLRVIDRQAMLAYLLRRKDPHTGGFSMHVDGEVDVRGTYCALSIARILRIGCPALLAGALDYIVSCQSYEGGISGTPGGEAHGGYTFCGLAAALLIGEMQQSLDSAASVDSLQGIGVRFAAGKRFSRNNNDCLHFVFSAELDYDAMLRWIVHRQMALEGGFQGRTNKLVDSCYR